MKFTKVIKADENFDKNIEQLKFNLTSDFFKALDATLAKYIKLWDDGKLSKEDILSCLEEACLRFQEAADDEL